MLRIISLVSLLMSTPLLFMSARYNYSYYGRVIHSSPGMTYVAYYNSATMGVPLQSPEDMTVFEDKVYVIDSQTHALTILDHDFSVLHHEHTFTFAPSLDKAAAGVEPEDEELTLFRPRGLDVRDSGIYICDTANHRIVKLDHDLRVVGVFHDIEDPTFETISFEPMKITVDSSERMYVVARNVYEGIVELGSEGEFNRFTGVNPLTPNPLEILRRSFMTEEQLAQLTLFLPTEYTNVHIDHRSFIYATSRPTGAAAENMIQLINPKGIDILVRNGYHPPMGDVHFIVGQNNYVVTGPSRLVSIVSTDHGIYTVLDQRRSRLFTYDAQGNLLYINGDEGAQSDRFSEGVAIAYFGDDILVLDRGTRTIVHYRPSEFGRAVNQAIAHQEVGEFEEASALWEDVLMMNSNYETAYNGLGRYHLRAGNYQEAMEYFRLGHDHYYYSKAFQLHRNNIIKDNFALIGAAALIVSGVFIGMKVRKTLKQGGTILYED